MTFWRLKIQRKKKEEEIKKEINMMTERRALYPHLKGGERVHLFRVFRASSRNKLIKLR